MKLDLYGQHVKELSVGETISVSVNGDNSTEIYLSTIPGNQPERFRLIANLTNENATYGPYSYVAKVKVVANGNDVDVDTVVSAIVGGSGGFSKTIGAIRELGSVYSTVLTNYTFQTNYLLPRKPYAIQFGFYGHGAAAIIGCKAGYQFSSDASSVGASALQMTTINNITFAGNSTFDLPARTASDSAINTQLGLILSDLMVIDQSTLLARNDGGTGYIIATRIFQPGGGAAITRSTAAGTELLNFSNDGYVKFGYKSSDAIATPNTTMTSGSIGAACVLIVYYENEVKTIYTIGDSTVQGYGSAAVHYMYGAARYFSKARIDAGNPVNIVSYANAGMDSKNYLANFMNHAETIQAGSTAVFSPYSPNDNAGVVNAQVYKSNVVKNANTFINFCNQLGIQPVLLTPNPANGYSAETETIRRDCVALVKSIASANNVKIIDRDAIYTDYSTSIGGYNSGLNSDALHPNAAGYYAESAEWLAVLQ